MGLTFIASASGTNDASGATLDCSASLNVVAGDLLVCWVCNETGASTYSVGSVSGSPPNTFTFDAGDAIANSVFGQMGYLLTAAADAAATFRCTWGTARDFRRLIVMQFRPVLGSSVVKDTSNKNTGFSRKSVV